MDILKEFYNLVSTAREMCAGSNVKELKEVCRAIRQAILYGYTYYMRDDYLKRLSEAVTKLEEAKEYKDRLEPDRILCDILNEIDKKGE